MSREQDSQTTRKLLPRQMRMVQLLHAIGGTARNLDFQKLLFLFCQDPASGKPYEFVPYKFGAFSFTSYADRRKLVERGVLAEDDQLWRLTEEGRRAIVGPSDAHVEAFARRNRFLRGDALVAQTYRAFPYYATRSEIAENILRGDDETLARIAATRAAVEGPALGTIGYEGHTLESYLNVLIKNGVTMLCDVRRNSISRKYGFSKGTLSRGCDGVGLRYEHIPELGIASEQRRGLETQADYDALFEDYERSWLPKQDESLLRIQGWIAAGERVALTCYEHLPHQCHRRCVAEVLEGRLGKDSRVKHY